MVKVTGILSPKTPTSATKRSLLETFGEEKDVQLVEDTDDIEDLTGPSTDAQHGSIAFDDHYKRCFIIESMTEVVDAKIKTDDPHVTVIKKVYNVTTCNPVGDRIVGIVWNQNAIKVAKHIE